MTTNAPPQQPVSLTIEQTLHQAVAQHQASQLQEAEKLYRAILQTHPNHPEVNHNMGVLLVQMKQPADALPHFILALEADPTRGQYWLNYIDALFQAGELETAREVLALAQQQGLEGNEVDALAVRLEGGTQIKIQSNVEHLHDFKESPPVSSAVSQCSKKKPKTKPVKLDKSAKKSPSRHEKIPSQQETNSLIALFTEGRLTEAASLAQTMTVRFPLHWVGWKMLGVVFKQMGRSADALTPMQKAASLSPDDVEAHNNLGITLQDLGRLDEAESSYRRALEINPDYAQAHSNLGTTLQDLGRLDEAEASYRQALQIKPDYAKAHSNLGATLQDQGRLDEAETSYRRALQINPDYAEAHSNLGGILYKQERLPEAEASYRRALEINSDDVEAHNNLGSILYKQDRFPEAEASYRWALQINPDYVEAHSNLGGVLYKQDRLSEAEASYRRVLQVNPDYFEAYNNLGAILEKQGKISEAEVSCRRALEIKPDYVEAHSNLGSILYKQERFTEAEASCRRALQLKPDFVSGHQSLGNTLYSLGKLDEAEASYRRALQLNPDCAAAYSNMLFALSHYQGLEAQALFAEHVRFGEHFEAPLRKSWPQHANSRNPGRCLQIGFVSADFRNHAVASFIEPILAHLSGYPKLSLHAYANHVLDDSTTQHLRGYFAHWNKIDRLTDAALTEKISADGIDILIDLSGHTGNNRLLTFAHKPAPVQASWIGYPGTTGLKAMDYFLADRFRLPTGQFDGQFTEKIVQMPISAPFLPFKAAPSINTLPALTNGYITFGSFNRLSKLSHAVIGLWSQLLRALPDSKMVLGGMNQDEKHDTLIEWFAQEGIEQKRLNFYPRTSMDDYLALHQQVDICLNPFPYTGGTTLCHALWMGVPTLTLTGQTIPFRGGVSFLGHVGLEEFAAQDAADFVHKGLSWASNLSALASLRTNLRERIEHSALGQPALAAAGVNRALRTMWQRWCSGLPAESFEVDLKTLDQEI